jgi:hypothetical protein
MKETPKESPKDTPKETPVDTGHLSGGEWNQTHAGKDPKK